MRSTLLRALALAGACALAAPSLAEEKAMAPPKPAKELSQLSWFVGNWTCKGKTFATPMGPEHATEGKVNIGHVLDGFFYAFHYDETKTAANPMPYHAAGFWGWDAVEKVFFENCYDAFGGNCRQTSKGWAGDVLSFEGPGTMGEMKTGMRDVFTKKSATEVVHRGEMQGPDGKWMATDEETCTKAGAKK
jgi:hypothetical protein